MASGGFWKKFEWAGRIETVVSFVIGDFARTLLLPAATALVTVATGYLGGVPLMWIIMAAALTFMAVTQGMLRASEYRERKNPENKIVSTGPAFSYDLVPAPAPATQLHLMNRHDRRRQGRATRDEPQQMLGINEVVPGVSRSLAFAQIGVNVRNTASFPISIILESANTEFAGLQPPRGQFPKPPTIMAPGSTVRVADDRLDAENIPCGRLPGKLLLVIKYGHPGDEKFTLRTDADLDIQLESWGFLSGIHAALRE